MMGYSKTEIANLALSHLGVGKTVANLDSERSTYANVLRQFYNPSLEYILRQFNWPFAKKTASLGLIEEYPTDEWAYSYALPSDCLRPIRILGTARTLRTGEDIKFLVFNSSAGKRVYTDQDNAVLEYTARATDPLLFDTDFVFALSYLLAGHIAPTVLGGGGSDVRKDMFGVFQFYMAEARASARSEEKPDKEPESIFVSGRE